ncbi:MAG: glycosyltransferase [Spirochaetes bacterium]|nr:glycosyltransferase [Spirochaetota bacterium]
MKNLLLISFKFPPYSDVGAYRWTKFVKYLSQKYIVHVITVRWKNQFDQPWHNDIDNENIKIHRIKSNYFHNFKYKKFSDDFSGRFLSKIRNQILKIVNFFYFIDEAQDWGKILMPYCLKLLKKENIEVIIATGGPYMVNYWAGILKRKLPDIKLIQDFRDEWNEFRYFPFKWQKNLSLKFEEFALNNCNALVTISKGLAEILSDKIKNKKIKVEVIHNGFDEESIDEITRDKGKIKRDFSFIYAGSLSNNRDKPMISFLDVVNDNIGKLQEIKIKLFLSLNDSKCIRAGYKRLIEDGHIIINDFISQDRLFNEIYNSFTALHFMPETQKFIISIKIFEYAMLKRPILSLNFGGDTEQLINSKKLGYSVIYKDNYQGIKNCIFKIFKLWERNPYYETESEKDIKDFSYKKLSEKYIELIEKL